MFEFAKSYGNSFFTWCKAIRNRSNEWSFLHVTNRTWITIRQDEDESDTRFDCRLWAFRKRSVVKLQWPNYRCFMKIRIQALVCLRRNASACCDFQVHVQGTLLYSRYPLLQDSRQPPWGWSGGWVIFHFKLKGDVICGCQYFVNVGFSTMESALRQPLLPTRKKVLVFSYTLLIFFHAYGIGLRRQNILKECAYFHLDYTGFEQTQSD